MEALTKNYNDKKHAFTKKTKMNLESLSINFDNMIVYISDSQATIKANYSIMGYYEVPTSTFTWAWANPFVEKNLIVTLKDSKYNKDKYEPKVKQLIDYIINTPVFYIDKQNIELLVKLGLYYLDDSIYIIMNRLNQTTIEFVVITRIINIQ